MYNSLKINDFMPKMCTLLESFCKYFMLSYYMTLVFVPVYIFRWSPKGQLVAHFHEHKAAINK